MGGAITFYMCIHPSPSSIGRPLRYPSSGAERESLSGWLAKAGESLPLGAAALGPPARLPVAVRAAQAALGAEARRRERQRQDLPRRRWRIRVQTIPATFMHSCARFSIMLLSMNIYLLVLTLTLLLVSSVKYESPSIQKFLNLLLLLGM